jgi:hypothetical protein
VQKLLSIFLLITIALSSVGMSVSQHSCSMSEQEIEANLCTMCSSEDHQQPAEDEESCCSDEAVHLRLETDATHQFSNLVLQPLIAVAAFDLELQLAPVAVHLPSASLLNPEIDPRRTERKTVLRV